MTWVKLSDDFGPRMAAYQVSDAAFRTHVEALNWCMFRLNDGVIPVGELIRFLESPNWSAAVDELIDIGLWSMNEGNQTLSVHFGMEWQRTPEQVEKERAATAARVAKHRAKKESDEA
jgi:hypothetical protein